MWNWFDRENKQTFKKTRLIDQVMKSQDFHSWLMYLNLVVKICPMFIQINILKSYFVIFCSFVPGKVFFVFWHEGNGCLKDYRADLNLDSVWYLNGRKEVECQMVWYLNAIHILDSPTIWKPDKWMPSCFLIYWSSILVALLQ